MNMRIKSNRIMGCLLCMMTLSGMSAGISDVVAKQRWPWSRLVDIDYVLTGVTGERVDVVLTAKDDATTLNLPLNSLTGDLYDVAPGLRRIVWDPTQTAYTNNLMLTQFNVTLAPTVPPLYMIVNLTKAAGTDGQIEYVYEADLHAGIWGSCVTNPVSNGETVIQSLVWTGVTNDTSYTTDKLVLRRVPAGEFGMGESADLSTTLTKGFYVGVFAVTDAQWNRALGSSSGTAKPKANVSYEEIRGASNNVPSVNWPHTDRTVVAPDSFLAKIRSRTGIAGFDLPTDAQWEYLCRAGTTTYYNDGFGTPGNVESNGQMNALGWYKGNCTVVQLVGEKAANAWGLYDTHGNVWEWCLDWYASSLSGGDDPEGADSGSLRVWRGGYWRSKASACRSASRNYYPPSFRADYIGFRLVSTLP